MMFCLLLWLIARGAAAGDGYDISVFTHLSGLDANSSCSIVSLTRTDGCYSLAACTDHKESEDYWCHTEVANYTELVTTTPEDKNFECPEQVMFITSPHESWLYSIHPSNFTFLKVRPFKRGDYKVLALSSSRQRLYCCYNYPKNKIGSIDFDDANQMIHVKKISCYSIAVDDINSIVFFAGIVKPVNMISRLKDVGYAIVKRMHMPPISMAVHPVSKTIFTSDYHKLTSFDYNGKDFKTLVEHSSKAIYSMCVKPRGDMLYYGTLKGIGCFDLKGPMRCDIPIDLPRGCSGLKISVYAYNRVIMSCTGKPHIVIFDPNTKDVQVNKIKNAYTIPFFIVRDCHSHNR